MNARENARTVALADDLRARLGRMKSGPKLWQFLSMVQVDAAARSPGALPDSARAVPFGPVRRVIEQDLDARVGELFDEFDEEPFAVASLGQVHSARTSDGERVAVKVQQPGLAEAVDADLRNLTIVGPILGRLAPALDAGAVLAEIRERISDELDYEVEAQHQRRLERRFRGHPHVRLPRVRTDLTTRRVLVSEYVEGLRIEEIRQLGEAERDRIGEVVVRFFFGLARRDGVVAGDPHADNCILCPDGRLCLLDFGLLRDVEADYLERESEILRAIADRDAQRVHAGVAGLGYLPEPEAVGKDDLLEYLSTTAEWMLSPGFRRIDPDYVAQVLEFGYPPRSPYFGLMRHLRLLPPTLLLRRMELQVLCLLGDLNAGGDWGAMTAEHHSGTPASTAVGREDRAFHAPRARPRAGLADDTERSGESS